MYWQLTGLNPQRAHVRKRMNRPQGATRLLFLAYSTSNVETLIYRILKKIGLNRKKKQFQNISSIIAIKTTFF